ncbi:unnamed protein product [Heterobilharzia americana]|nr:unnamed protein product [Heterobilharzia americana]
MESNEEFVVVDDENNRRQDSVARLDVLVDLFKKTIETLNQSSILLKDELQTALSVTLQNVTPDHSTTIEDLVRQLDNISVSPDDVRKAYVKQLCSRLVAVNEEKQFVMTELVELNDQLRTMEVEARKWKKLIEPISKVAADIKELESTYFSESEVDSVDTELRIGDESTVDDVYSFLNATHNKIQNLRNKELFLKNKVDKSTLETCSAVCLVDSIQVSSAKECLNSGNSNAIQTDETILKCDAWMQAEVSSPTVISSNATNQVEPPAYASLAKAMINQATESENINLKQLVREEIFRILNEKSQTSSMSNMTTFDMDNRLNSLLTPVVKPSSNQPSLISTGNEISTSITDFTHWPNLRVSEFSSVDIPPTSITSEAFVNGSQGLTEVSTSNESNLISYIPNNYSSESYRKDATPSEPKALMSSFFPYIGGFVRRQIQQIVNMEIPSDYGSWLSELGLNPSEGNFNQSVKRHSTPSFSAHELYSLFFVNSLGATLVSWLSTNVCLTN